MNRLQEASVSNPCRHRDLRSGFVTSIASVGDGLIHQAGEALRPGSADDGEAGSSEPHSQTEPQTLLCTRTIYRYICRTFHSIWPFSFRLSRVSDFGGLFLLIGDQAIDQQGLRARLLETPGFQGLLQLQNGPTRVAHDGAPWSISSSMEELHSSSVLRPQVHTT